MLKVKALTKIFGGLRAVDNASLEVGAGQIVSCKSFNQDIWWIARR